MRTCFVLLFCFFGLNTGFAQQEDVCYNPNLIKDTTKKSIRSMAVGVVDGDSIKITYHSPGVRDRIIWGGLVPYNEVWVTGAHDATTVIFPGPVMIGGIPVPAGRYAFFTIPGRKEWTIIINKHWQQHLASEYDEKDDVVRVKIKPKKNRRTERLQYFIEEREGHSGKLIMAWERVKKLSCRLILFPVQAKRTKKARRTQRNRRVDKREYPAEISQIQYLKYL